VAWNGPRSAPGTSAQRWWDTDNLYADIAAYTLRFPFLQILPSMESENAQKSQLPSITLLNGRGLLQASGEKFTTNSSIGTVSMNVPIPTNPRWGGFGPALSLSYDSSNANGVFGFG
jgi:hypothetical protein